MKDNFYETEKQLELWKEEYHKPKMTKEQVEHLCQSVKNAKTGEQKGMRKASMLRFAVAAAACITAFVAVPNLSATAAYAMGKIPVIGSLVRVVTFCDYQYDTDRNMADISVPELELDAKATESDTQNNITKTTDEINTEIKEITSRIIKEFKDGLKDEKGYQDVVIYSEVLATTEDYFTLKLICYQGAGSGAEQDYYYTIDLKTGERLHLKDLFKEGSDYITPISKNIKAQMREQMKKDENVYYWLEDEIKGLNFKAITDKTSFYLNENNEVVIAFNEGDVAPMYMGCVEFVISSDVLTDIRI